MEQGGGWVWTVCGSGEKSVTGFCDYRKEV